MPYMPMCHEVDPKQALNEEIGDLSDFTVFYNEILVAVYLRPQKTKSGIILTDQHRDEDKYQSKIGLVVKMGKDAFNDDTGKWDFGGTDVHLNSWVWHRPSDGFSVTVNGVLCRVLKDTSIRGTVAQPDMVW